MNTLNHATIERFYTAFVQLDHATMQACYAPDAQFADEAFTLRGQQQIGAMWRMLCTATRTSGMAHWQLHTRDITDHSAHWHAHYLFSSTGRVVDNHISAEFSFNEQGLITQHRDRFDFWRWSRQALGTPGLLLGWTPWLRAKVRQRAARQLAQFIARG